MALSIQQNIKLVVVVVVVNYIQYNTGNVLYVLKFAFLMALSIQHGSMFINDPQHNKTNKMTCAPSEDSDQPGRMSCLIRIFAVRIRIIGSFATYADLSLHWAGRTCHFVGYIVRRLKFCFVPLASIYL